MVRVLDSGPSGPGSGPGRGHCVVFLGKTLYSHGASLHPGVEWVPAKMLGVTLRWTGIPSRGEYKYS